VFFENNLTILDCPRMLFKRLEKLLTFYIVKKLLLEKKNTFAVKLACRLLLHTSIRFWLRNYSTHLRAENLLFAIFKIKF